MGFGTDSFEMRNVHASQTVSACGGVQRGGIGMQGPRHDRARLRRKGERPRERETARCHHAHVLFSPFVIVSVQPRREEVSAGFSFPGQCLKPAACVCPLMLPHIVVSILGGDGRVVRTGLTQPVVVSERLASC